MDATKIIAPYGTWSSPITSELIASAAIQLGQIVLDAELYFYSMIFAFELPDDIEPVAIANLPEVKQAVTTQAMGEEDQAA